MAEELLKINQQTQEKLLKLLKAVQEQMQQVTEDINFLQQNELKASQSKLTPVLPNDIKNSLINFFNKLKKNNTEKLVDSGADQINLSEIMEEDFCKFNSDSEPHSNNLNFDFEDSPSQKHSPSKRYKQYNKYQEKYAKMEKSKQPNLKGRGRVHYY